MDFKYKSYLDTYKTCMISDCEELERPAYRWVFEDKNDPDNFKPQFLKSDFENHSKKNCNGYGLSFFDKKIEARNALIKRCKDKENAYKVVGSHIAGGNLKKEDGVSSKSSTDPKNFGHFSFFEYVNVDLVNSFEIVEKVFGDE